jgi:hypothetical protein
MRHFIIECTRVNDNISSLEVEREAIQAPESRAIQVFPVGVVVRPVKGTFEAEAVIEKWYGAAQVDAALVQRDPVRAIRILEDGLGVQLIAEICPFQQKVGILREMHHVGFRLLAVEHTGLVNPGIEWFGSLEIRFFPYVNGAAMTLSIL